MNTSNDNDKLDWMYKGTNSQVDREDYLLGKTVDKSFEQLNNEEKEKKLGVVPPKNHVEHECIPPSIRDYNKIVHHEQVDLSAKLQEDPLVAIKKQEEEARRQFLQNPIQLKKLQEALIAQECKKKKKKKRKKKKQSDSEDDLDKQLHEKLKNIKGSSLTSRLLKKEKKKDKDDHLDTILMHKYNHLKDKLSQKDIDDVLAGKIDSEDESPIAKKQKKGRSLSNSSSEDDYDSDAGYRKPHKFELKSNRVHNKYDYKGNKKSYPHEKSSRNDSSSNNFNNRDEIRYKNATKEKYRNPESISRHKQVKYNYDKDKYSRRNRHSSSSSSRSSKSSGDERLKKIHKESHKPDEDLDKMILQKLRMLRESRTDKHEEKDDNLKEYSHYDSDNDEYVIKKKAFGLVRSDGTKIPLKNPIPEPKKVAKNAKTSKTVVEKKQNKKLNDREKEELRKQMLEDAVKRDIERSDNLKKHRLENQQEENKINDFDKNFVHRELSKSQSNIKDVESRIRSKLNNIQRSSQHMNSNFSKRS